ncbi:Membrane bound O-acyltransferase domain-containing protein, putative [Perkinsus marinus ATCC 50983]|uniref:Membrane bound O-acyltransferase domain-containing protein, putative n=1 Tax=Perkinsus marinus (strain ATCC 50983 / TXsc) TaxID=423536 RepID=C5KAN7_PERM5|nr:Membrane bound O-acyltransferase domain-containing protein, putative [Perkinsus marinus ATCC 50983]EER18213.1 Membrane bound O-acyltransferase domain-containing protein, putative [Perkinsus marinus ATCC 50983]|eukprot:XP_002786417.1 Membrane bound O-acyltransferase domain-containing protein, putative [Perkinsus marinus ATCC 50983]
MSSSDFAHLPGPLTSGIHTVADTLGFPADQIVLLGCLLLSIGISFWFRTLTTGTTRLYTSLILGIGLTYVLQGPWNTAVVVMVSIVNYVLVVLFPRKPSIVAVNSMSILSAFHIWRMRVDYLGWKLDVTLPLMIFTAKYVTFAYDCYDGCLLKEGKPLSSKKHEVEYRMNNCLQDVPDILSYLSYIFGFFGALTGPVFFCREYLDWVYLRGCFSNLDRINTVRPTMKALVKCAGCGIVMLFANTFLPVSGITSSWFNALPFPIRVPLLCITVSWYRSRFFFCWYLCEAVGDACGFGLSDAKTETFKRAENGDVLHVEFALNAPEALNNWNTRVAEWLKYYIYQRVTKPSFITFMSTKSYATLITRSISAFWHGFYPGYYLFFLCTILESTADSIGRHYLGPMFYGDNAPYAKYYPFYAFFAWAQTFFSLNYYGTGQVMLEYGVTMEVWRSVYFVGHIWHIAVIVLLPMLVPKKKKINGEEMKERVKAE